MTLETKAQLMATCPKCGEEKNSGENAQIVCWGDCWRNKTTGLKYTQKTTEEWLKENWKKEETFCVVCHTDKNAEEKLNNLIF